MPVAIPTTLLPNSSMVRAVIMEDADRFTILLPTSTVLSILPGFSITRVRISASLFPASARVLIRSLFTVVRAVSAEEKNADKASNASTITICMPVLSPESNI